MTAPVSQYLLMALSDDEQDRVLELQAKWAAYGGERFNFVKKNEPARPLRPLKTSNKDGKPTANDNVAVNLCRLIVNKGVSMLMKGVEWELEEGDQTDEEKWLDGVWGRRKAALLKTYALDGGVTGHPFMRIRLEGQSGGKPQPRLIVLDPACVTPTYDLDDIEKVTRYKVQYSGLNAAGKMETRRQLISLEDTGQSWAIEDQRSLGDSGAWVTVGTPETWPYPFAPIVHNQNLMAPHEFWGAADLEADTVSLNYSLNAVLSNINKIVRLWSHPRTFASGVEGGDPISVDADTLIKLPNSEAKVWTVEMTKTLADAIAFMESLREFFHEVSRVPEVTAGRLDKVGQLSGLAMQILYAPIVELTEDKQETYGEALEDLNKRLLVIGGYRTIDDEYDVTIHWPNIIPSDPAAEAQTALVWDQLGVSRDTILTKLDFNPDLELQKKAAEQDALGTAILGQFNTGASQVQPVAPTGPPGQPAPPTGP